MKDKTIIVTGSATGIGEAIARRCVAEGAKVVIHDINRDLAAKVGASLGTSAFVHCNDLIDPASAPDLINAAVKAFGKIDGLVNNAAFIPRGNIDTADAALFDKCMAINARAPMLLIKAAVRYLQKTRGCVLNIGSVNAYCGEPNLLPYSISKGALMTLTRNLGDALHRDHGIRVNQINPGWVLTPGEMVTQMKMGKPETWHKELPREFAPTGTIITPEQLATVALFWISNESRPCSGSVMEFEQFPIIGRNPPKEIAK